MITPSYLPSPSYLSFPRYLPSPNYIPSPCYLPSPSYLLYPNCLPFPRSAKDPALIATPTPPPPSPPKFEITPLLLPSPPQTSLLSAAAYCMTLLLTFPFGFLILLSYP